MGLFEKDYLLRLLEQLTAMVAAIRGSVQGGKNAEALAAIAEAQDRLAGPLASGLARLDGSSVVALLGKEKAAIYVTLLRLEAEARDGLSDARETVKARAAEARAEAIERATR
jgi:hypothetical protein